MMLNRRGFLKTAAGLIVAAGAGELLLPERRVWALDRTMVGERPFQAEDMAQAIDAWNRGLMHSKALEGYRSYVASQYDQASVYGQRMVAYHMAEAEKSALRMILGVQNG